MIGGPWLTVTCPECAAGPGMNCTAMGPLNIAVHPARRDRAEQYAQLSNERERRTPRRPVISASAAALLAPRQRA